jgi:hypothetical protein
MQRARDDSNCASHPMKRARDDSNCAPAAAADSALPFHRLGEGVPTSCEADALAWCEAASASAPPPPPSAASLLRGCASAPAARALAWRRGPAHASLATLLVALADAGAGARVAVHTRCGRRYEGLLAPGASAAGGAALDVALAPPAALRLPAARVLAVEPLSLAAPWPALHHAFCLREAGLLTATGERRVGAGGAAQRV